MKNLNSSWTVLTTNDSSIDRDTNRIYTCLYVAKEGKEYVAYVSCDDYIKDKTLPINMTIEFLTKSGYDNVELPYSKELFDEIEYQAKQRFLELKEESVSA